MTVWTPLTDTVNLIIIRSFRYFIKSFTSNIKLTLIGYIKINQLVMYYSVIMIIKYLLLVFTPLCQTCNIYKEKLFLCFKKSCKFVYISERSVFSNTQTGRIPTMAQKTYTNFSLQRLQLQRERESPSVSHWSNVSRTTGKINEQEDMWGSEEIHILNFENRQK
jgi:hypothetical protein